MVILNRLSLTQPTYAIHERTIWESDQSLTNLMRSIFKLLMLLYIMSMQFVGINTVLLFNNVSTPVSAVVIIVMSILTAMFILKI